MKDRKDVVVEFNELVNMTASELEKWLKSDDSNSAGWPKGDEGGESVGHDSGRKIVEILKSNPDKAEDKYSDDDVEHMRKVVAYCKRHLAQEKGPNSNKSEEELKKTKSYASLKNWGHDFLKGQDKANGGSKKETGESDEDKKSADEEHDKNGDAKADEEEQLGDKRKTRSSQAGSNKRQDTKKPKKSNGGEAEDDEYVEDEAEEADNDEDEAAEQNEAADETDANGADNGPEKGDTVSWKWGGGHPEGKVLDVKEDKTTITTKNGNQVSRDGSKDDPAVVLDAGKSKAIKLAHELD